MKGGEGREMGMKERWKGKEPHGKQREKRDEGEKGRVTWNKGVICVPHCGSALLATI